MTNIEQSLNDALREARNEALEEAARVVDESEFLETEARSRLIAAVLKQVADNIRALKSQEQGDG